MRRRILLLIAPFTLLAAGCGAAAGQDSSEDLQGPPREVAVTIEDLQEAAADRDAERVCNQLLAQEARERMRSAGTRCVPAVEEALEAIDDAELQVREGGIDIQGDRATARVEAGRDEDAQAVTIQLAREGRNWKIAGFGEGA